uniref:Uncharacterized protein n=1 Tax=Anguilla anguilla TaxID=7936 RepID=A0A0E9U1G3_ANGAN
MFSPHQEFASNAIFMEISGIFRA